MMGSAACPAAIFDGGPIMPAGLDAQSVGPVDVAVILFEGTNSAETWLRRWPS